MCLRRPNIHKYNIIWKITRLQVGRNAWGAPVCLALGPSPHKAFIAEQALQGVSILSQHAKVSILPPKISVIPIFQHMQVSMAGVVPSERGGSLHQCFPLYRFYWASKLFFKAKPGMFQLAAGLGQPQSQLLQPWHWRRWDSGAALCPLAPGGHWGAACT